MSEPLDKIRQKILLNWLKQQAKQNSNLQRLSVFTGLISAIGIIMQAFLIATILQKLIIDNKQFSDILPYFILLAALFLLRTLLNYCREKIHFSLGETLRKTIRKQIIDRIEQVGPTSITQETTGGLSTLLIEQVEDLQDFYAHYLPQMQLATFIPILILIAIIPFNWAAALILFCTAPLIPIFMILVGMGASDVNRKNFKALSFLSGHFLDRLKGLQTIRLFNQGKNQTINIHNAAEDFRIKTMNVLTMAFLSSSVLEFFTSISIAVVAVYFGFSYLGEFHFGSYHQSVTLFAGFFSLILAPEFFQPLRDLGTYYHAKAQAIAAADNIERFLTTQNLISSNTIKNSVHIKELKSITANNLIILSTDHKKIVGPLNFHLDAPFNLALMGISGEGKSSLLNLLLGFLPYEGSFKINDIEFHTLNIDLWRNQLSWLGQNPYLLNDSIRNNILLADPNADQTDLNKVIKQAQLTEFIDQLPQGLDTKIGEDSVRISVGQAQRIAIARALLKPCKLLLLDEPTSSLDKQTSQEIESILFENYFKDSQFCNVIMVTHQKSDIIPFNHIWRLHNNKIHLERES